MNLNKLPAQKPVKFPFQSGQLALFILLVISLAGCHFPQAITEPTSPDELGLRLTLAAGLQTPTPYLYPDLPTPTVTAPALRTPTPGAVPQYTPNAPASFEHGYYRYILQPGDTLPVLALRFGVSVEAIQTDPPLPEAGFLPPGGDILIPAALEDLLPYALPLLPDTEVLYGPTVGDFNAAAYARAAGGFLSGYEEPVGSTRMAGPDIVQLVAIETSTNPRLLLTFLEYRSGWVLGHPDDAKFDAFPIGYGATPDTGLYKELMITAKILAQGFYGWRDGSELEVAFYGGESGRLHPGLNAGSAALLRLFGVLYSREVLEIRLFSEPTFLDLYRDMFGEAWSRAENIPTNLTEDLRQPRLYLPFAAGAPWSLTAGPHITWQTGTPRGALDFAPITGESPCAVSFRWATAAAPGLVVRSQRGVVAIDLDGDGDEGTGWVLVYMHIAESGRVPLGTWLDLNDPIGHPSCEGGRASGTHVHIARKYNGEWLPAQGPLPMKLSGWVAFPGEGRYEGYLKQGDEIVTARPDGSHGSTIYRED